MNAQQTIEALHGELILRLKKYQQEDVERVIVNPIFKYQVHVQIVNCSKEEVPAIQAIVDKILEGLSYHYIKPYNWASGNGIQFWFKPSWSFWSSDVTPPPIPVTQHTEI